jgi:hypothetical protein
LELEKFQVEKIDAEIQGSIEMEDKETQMVDVDRPEGDTQDDMVNIRGSQ